MFQNIRSGHGKRNTIAHTKYYHLNDHGDVVSLTDVDSKVAKKAAAKAIKNFASSKNKLKLNLQQFARSMNTKEATAAAKELGYTKSKFTSHNQPVFKKGNKYITPDVDGHNGGVWKMASSVKNLGSKRTRKGTMIKFKIGVEIK